MELPNESLDLDALLNKWREVQGYFSPAKLMQVSEFDWETYRLAYKHFCDVDIAVGGQHAQPPRRKTATPHVSDKEELELAKAILTYQHELQHFYQTTSTAFGMSLYIVESLYFDFLRQFAQILLAKLPNISGKCNLMLTAQKWCSDSGTNFWEFDHGVAMLGCFQALRGLFDNPTIRIDDLVSQWNGITEILDSSERKASDNIRFVRFSTKQQPLSQANPAGITLKGLVESSAHCEEMCLLGSLPVREDTMREIFGRAHWGDYRQIWDRLEGVIASCQDPRIISRVISIALQSPLTSMHTNTCDEPVVLVEDTSPTFRAHRVIEALTNGSIDASDVLQPAGPDLVCDHFGWPRVCSVMGEYLRKPIYRGVDDTLDLIHEGYRSFSVAARSSSMNPVWMGDFKSATDHREIEFAKSFLPPFSCFKDRLIIQTNIESAVRMAGPLLTTFAAKELLFKEELGDTIIWIDRFAQAFARIDEKVGRLFVNKFWPNTFMNCFGAQWEEWAKA